MRVHDLCETLVVVVKGKAQLPDAPVGHRPLGFAQQVVLDNNVGPPALVERVDQVKVDVVGLELCELFIQKAVEVRRPLHHPGGELGRQPNLLAISILERPANDELALAIVIGIGSVDVIHAVIDGVTQHANRFGFIDIGAAALAIGARESHAAEAQGGGFPIQLSKRAILHDGSLLRELI